MLKVKHIFIAIVLAYFMLCWVGLYNGDFIFCYDNMAVCKEDYINLIGSIGLYLSGVIVVMCGIALLDDVWDGVLYCKHEYVKREGSALTTKLDENGKITISGYVDFYTCTKCKHTKGKAINDEDNQ